VIPIVGNLTPSGLRRLTHSEYDRTIYALPLNFLRINFEGDTANGTLGPSLFVPDPSIEGYENYSVALAVSTIQAELYGDGECQGSCRPDSGGTLLLIQQGASDFGGV